MSEPRKPKLLIFGGGEVDPASLAGSLGSDFELVITDADHALETLEQTACEAVLLPAGQLIPFERQLHAHESETLLHAIGEGLCLAEADGVILWSNAMYASYDQTVKRRLGEVIRAAGEHFKPLTSAEPSGLPTVRPKRYKLSLKRRDRHFEALASPLISPMRSNADGESAARVVRIALAIRDVSPRERTRRRIEAINAAGQELLHIEAETVERLHAVERLKLLEQRVVRYADELLHFDHFAIRMINPRLNRLQVVIARDLSEEAISQELEVSETSNGISGWVAATGRSYLCTDTTCDPLYKHGLDNAGSSLTVPLKLFDGVIGVFNVESHDTGAFTEQDRQFAEIFAGYLAMSLHILNLLVVERRTTREQATGTVRGELSAPLNDLMTEAESLRAVAGSDDAVRRAVERIIADVGTIRARVRKAEATPQAVLGLDDLSGRDAEDAVLTGKRILVVDDDQSMRDTISDILSACGARVVTCESAASAKKLLKQWQLTFDADEAFDLVISDIDTGDGTGYDVFSAARAASESLPVILMTGFGYDPHHSIVRASQEGLQSVLFKPFRGEKLIQEARKAIDPQADAPS
ncbi:MAG: response regulator [Planctomycetota bacterium]